MNGVIPRAQDSVWIVGNRFVEFEQSKPISVIACCNCSGTRTHRVEKHHIDQEHIGPESKWASGVALKFHFLGVAMS